MSAICPHIGSIQLTDPIGSNHRVRGLPRDRRNMGASAHVPILRSNHMLR
jgi:hypothetical protein